jgi:hypothetical protein
MTKLTYACALTREITRIASLCQEILQLVPRRDRAYVEFSTELASLPLDNGSVCRDRRLERPTQPGAAVIMLEFEVDNVDAEAANCSLAGLGGRQ